MMVGQSRWYRICYDSRTLTYPHLGVIFLQYTVCRMAMWKLMFLVSLLSLAAARVVNWDIVPGKRDASQSNSLSSIYRLTSTTCPKSISCGQGSCKLIPQISASKLNRNYMCYCTKGYGGINCDIDDPCSKNPCSGQQKCITTSSSISNPDVKDTGRICI